MKKSLFCLVALAFFSPLLEGRTLYDITLSNTKKYTQCAVLIESPSSTKFRGTDANGHSVTMQVKTSSILLKKAVKEDKKEPAPQTLNQPSTDPQPESQPEPPKEPAPAQLPPAQPAPGSEALDKAQDVSLKLRERLAEVDKALAGLKKPSRSIVSICKNGKTRIERNLETIDKNALEVQELQKQFNENTMGDYQFDKVSQEERGKYEQDAMAAYKAMLADMKERRGSRKVGGLDKFELLRERYQGIPEYKQAYDWYLKTLRSLNKKWSTMLEKEQMRRKALVSEKKKAMTDADKESLEMLINRLAANGQEVTSVWFHPDPRNLEMIRTCLNKVQDALRRNNATDDLDPESGHVPDLINQFWAMMDDARAKMIAGELDEANDTIRNNNDAYQKILGLKSNLLPQEYREPLKAQYGDLQREIRDRSRSYQALKRKLERATDLLERSASNAEAQLDSMLEAIENEQNLEMEENSINLQESGEDDSAGAEEQGKEGEKNGEEKSAPEEGTTATSQTNQQ